MRLLLGVLVSVLLVPGVARAAPLTNTAHLDYLGDTVTPPAQPGHSTYGDGPLGVLWTYADRQADGSYKRIGGGPYDAATNTYGQGAFNADDVSRAAVVYVRHWRATGSAASRARAVALLRGLTYLQSPNGNVVLWMQPDGTLNPSAEPVELPDPSDSGPSYWLARTVWALGEAQRAFRRDDPAFARFLAARMDRAIAALERDVLSKYGQWQIVDGKRVPDWLIVDGADATAEAMLGLAAYGIPRARRALRQFGEGVAALSSAGGGQEKGTRAAQILATPGETHAVSGREAGWAVTWPYGAVLPWALSRSIWHAWASQMPAALAASGHLEEAAADTGAFTSHLLIAAGPENGWNPAPTDGVQIAYGADSRLQSLLAVDRPGQRALAGVAAAWYFGNNPAKAPMYDPATGRTYDGVARDGTINRNSGAESTIHGLLSMLALDAHPDVAARARHAIPLQRTTWRTVEAEDVGTGTVVRPPDAWTGESAWSGGAYVQGGTISFDAEGLIQPIALRAPDGGSSRWGALGTLSHTGGAPQGVSAIPGFIEPQTLARPAHGRVTATLAPTTRLDAILVQPLIETLRLEGQTLARSFDDRPRRLTFGGTSYDATGRPYDRDRKAVVIPPGGFALG